MDPDSNLDSNPDPNPDPKRLFQFQIESGSGQRFGSFRIHIRFRIRISNTGKKEPYFQAEIRWFHMIIQVVTELREGSLLCLKTRLGKNFRKKEVLASFLSRSESRIRPRIQIRDSNPDSNTDLDPDSNPDPNLKLTAGRILIRNRIRNFCF